MTKSLEAWSQSVTNLYNFLIFLFAVFWILNGLYLQLSIKKNNACNVLKSNLHPDTSDLSTSTTLTTTIWLNIIPSVHFILLLIKGYGAYRHFQQYFSHIVAVSLLVNETVVPGENHRPTTSHWQTWSRYIVSNILEFNWSGKTSKHI